MSQHWAWIFMLSATATGCGGNQPALREVCTIHTEREPGLPRLYRRANAGTLNLGPAQLLCGVPKQDRKPADRCEDVDDLSALLGTGKVCGPMGTESQAVCPRYADDRLQPEAPTQPAAPCAGACDNRQIVVREASGTATRVLFYDDPECHSAGDPLCPGSARPCYYRVLSITSELR